MTSPSVVDLTRGQVAAIFGWARRTPAILSVYLFGSRAKGASRPDSDVDLAVAVETTPGLTNQNSYDQHWLEWVSDLNEGVGLCVDLLRLHATETPNTLAAVDQAGILLYRRDADRAERTDRAVTKRLEADHPKRACLVPLKEAADLFVDEAEAKSARDPDAETKARRRFYRRLMKSVRQREFEGTNRLFIVHGSVVRLDRRTEALLSEASEDISDELIASHWSHAWTARATASAWCRRHNFKVPDRWNILKTVRRAGGRPPTLEPAAVNRAVYGLMDHHGEFSSDDREWSSQARLEAAVRDRFQTSLSESRLRELITPPLKAWRAKKSGQGR